MSETMPALYMLDNELKCHPHISKSWNHKTDARFYLGVKGLKVKDNYYYRYIVDTIIQQVLTTHCSDTKYCHRPNVVNTVFNVLGDTAA